LDKEDKAVIKQLELEISRQPKSWPQTPQLMRRALLPWYITGAEARAAEQRRSNNCSTSPRVAATTKTCSRPTKTAAIFLVRVPA
jgi:hypothetical protein